VRTFIYVTCSTAREIAGGKETKEKSGTRNFASLCSRTTSHHDVGMSDIAYFAETNYRNRVVPRRSPSFS
jgi:hypothetical protein